MCCYNNGRANWFNTCIKHWAIWGQSIVILNMVSPKIAAECK